MPWRELRYVLYARAFGWTPDEVDEIPLSMESLLLPIDSAIGADLKRRADEEQNKTGNQAAAIANQRQRRV